MKSEGSLRTLLRIATALACVLSFVSVQIAARWHYHDCDGTAVAQIAATNGQDCPLCAASLMTTEDVSPLYVVGYFSVTFIGQALQPSSAIHTSALSHPGRAPPALSCF